jgi:hypothetical protein
MHRGFLFHMIGLIGTWLGLVTLTLNVATLRTKPRLPDLPKRRFVAICASALGLLVCPVTFFIGVPSASMEQRILEYGWPFPTITTDRFGTALGPEWIVGDVAFWLFAPQILVYLYMRFFARSTTTKFSRKTTAKPRIQPL